MGFSFVADEYAIKVGGNYNYIDFLLYNYKYKCYAVVELKTIKLRKENIGQIKYYMNYIDKFEMSESDRNTIGIIISRKMTGLLSSLVQMNILYRLSIKLYKNSLIISCIYAYYLIKYYWP